VPKNYNIQFFRGFFSLKSSHESFNEDLTKNLQRIADILERIYPKEELAANLTQSDAFVWQAEKGVLEPVYDVNVINIELLHGINSARDTLLENTQRFAQGFPANNALLWGARGMGKSSLVKAVHHETKKISSQTLVLIEIHREDIPTLPLLLKILKISKRRFILFCDDLSFESNDTSYKSLKALLEGGIEGRPNNVIFYATSNRRHLISRNMIENEQSSSIHPGESVEETVSLSDRFGIWLGFHSCDQETYLKMVIEYKKYYKLNIDTEQIKKDAIQWSIGRGARSGRVAWQFIQEIAGRLGVTLEK
tara:strand:+ start:14722 stop:15645 length:924 start_codon:yes stop_codon:yes gene_type:complete